MPWIKYDYWRISSNMFGSSVVFVPRSYELCDVSDDLMCSILDRMVDEQLLS